MRWLKRIGLIIAALLLAAQLVPIDRRNPPIDPSQTIYATAAVPANVRAVLQGSCQNCHSNQTQWPWYSHIAPVSWLVTHDVNRGRAEMNLSVWGTYSQKKKEEKAEAICEQLVNGDMPDGKYLLIHRRAHLTQEQQDAVCTWVESMR